MDLRQTSSSVNIQPVIRSYLEASLVSVRNDVLSTVGETVTRQTERHTQPAVLILKLLVGGTLVLCTLPARLTASHQLVAREDQVDLGLHTPVPQGHRDRGWVVEKGTCLDINLSKPQSAWQTLYLCSVR